MAAETGGTSSLSLCDKLGLTARWRQRPQCTSKHVGWVPYRRICHPARRILSWLSPPLRLGSASRATGSMLA